MLLDHTNRKHLLSFSFTVVCLLLIQDFILEFPEVQKYLSRRLNDNLIS